MLDVERAVLANQRQPKLFESGVQIQNLIVDIGARNVIEVDGLPGHESAVFDATFLTGGIDEDSTHRLSDCGEKMSSAIPSLNAFAADQPDVRLVNERRGLERLTWRFLIKLMGGQFPQLVVDQRQQLLGRVRAVSGEFRKYAGNIAQSRKALAMVRWLLPATRKLAVYRGEEGAGGKDLPI